MDEGGHRLKADGASVAVKVFTSWDGKRSTYDRERLASLEVQIFNERGLCHRWDENNDQCFLRGYDWVNGVWDIRGEQMTTYVFPLPGITESSGEHKVVKRRQKRKREEIDP